MVHHVDSALININAQIPEPMLGFTPCSISTTDYESLFKARISIVFSRRENSIDIDLFSNHLVLLFCGAAVSFPLAVLLATIRP